MTSWPLGIKNHYICFMYVINLKIYIFLHILLSRKSEMQFSWCTFVSRCILNSRISKYPSSTLMQVFYIDQVKEPNNKLKACQEKEKKIQKEERWRGGLNVYYPSSHGKCQYTVQHKSNMQQQTQNFTSSI